MSLEQIEDLQKKAKNEYEKIKKERDESFKQKE